MTIHNTTTIALALGVCVTYYVDDSGMYGLTVLVEVDGPSQYCLAF
jgi:hypothetical protein